jgi:CO dehydrogenase nickel-insertion accessory protein CooC1
MQRLAGKLHIRVGRRQLIVNRATSRNAELNQDDLPGAVRVAIATHGLEVAGFVPRDENVAEYDAQGLPFFDLPADAPAHRAVSAICAALPELDSRLPRARQNQHIVGGAYA